MSEDRTRQYMNHERMTLYLAFCFMTIVALMTGNGLTATTTVYAAHNKHGSSNQTSSSSNNGMSTSSSSGSHNNNSPSSSTSGSGAPGSKDNSGAGSASNPAPSSGSGTATGNSGTGTGAGTKAAPTITLPATTKKTTGNNPCLTSLPPTSCSSSGTSGSSGNQSQNNHKDRHHTAGGLGSFPNAYTPGTKDYKHYGTGLPRHQNSSIGTPSGTGASSNRTHDGPYGPKTGGKGAGEQNGAGPCVDSHYGAYERGCGIGTHCIFIQGHGLFCRHGYVGGESHNVKYEGDTKVMHETEIKVIREPSSGSYNGPSSVVLLSPTSNDYVNNDPTTISVDHVTITSSGVQGWIKGTVTNNSNQTMHELRITGTWYDSGNSTIGMSSGYVGGLSLNPGQSGTFSQFADYDYGRTPGTVELSYDWQ
ncbi:MAG: FxLYD domain-containing protein [Candidatus Nitrosopolaris sp.]